MTEWKSVKDEFAKYKNELDYSKVEYKVVTNGSEYQDAVDNDPQYSLEVDPTNKYHFSNDEKEFVKLYCEYKNLAVVSQLLGLEPDVATLMMRNFKIMAEIKRINKAQYHQRIAAKMISLDELGGYLTTLISDDVPVGDQVDIKQKMNAAKMLIDIQKLKYETSQNVEVLNAVPVESLTDKIKDLSTSEIKTLLYKEMNQNKINEITSEKDELIKKIDPNRSKLTVEEHQCLETLSVEELELLVKSNADPSEKFKRDLRKKRKLEMNEKQRQADLNLTKTVRDLKQQIEIANNKSENE